MAGRFIKLYDKILQWEWYSDINTFRLFIHLLLKANYKDLHFEGHTILRGQLVTSLPKLASQTGLTVRQIRVSLDRLKMTGEVSSSSYPRYRVITVIKYDEYQSDGRQNGSQMTGEMSVSGQARDRLMTGSRQARDRLMTASIDNIEYIEQVEEIEKIDNKTLPQGGKDSFLEDSFNTFWACYPKKVDKQEAKKAWRKLKPNPDLADEIMSGLSKWTESYDWQKDDGRYIPYPATWLNKRRWEDDPGKTPERSSQPRKTVSAQNYSQRDYSHVDDDIMADVARDMERFKAGGGVR